jgi:hypothetical protein
MNINQFDLRKLDKCYCLGSSGSIKEGSTSRLIKESLTTSINRRINRKSTRFNEGSLTAFISECSLGLNKEKSTNMIKESSTYLKVQQL